MVIIKLNRRQFSAGRHQTHYLTQTN